MDTNPTTTQKSQLNPEIGYRTQEKISKTVFKEVGKGSTEERLVARGLRQRPRSSQEGGPQEH